MNARQAAKHWKKKYEELAKKPIPWTFYQKPIKEYACRRYFERNEWIHMCSHEGAWQYIINECANEIGKAVINNSMRRIEIEPLMNKVTLTFKSQIVDISDGNPLPQNARQI